MDPALELLQLSAAPVGGRLNLRWFRLKLLPSVIGHTHAKVSVADGDVSTV
jgi:hypothetical protein